MIQERLNNRDTKYKKVGDKHYVEFYENEKMIGIIDYSKHSMHYVDDAIENFVTGLMTLETIERYNVRDKSLFNET